MSSGICINIVTAASSNHFKSLKQMLGTLDRNKVNCYVYNLGLSDTEIAELKALDSIHYRVFDFSKHPEYFNIKVEAGQYAWKPAIIKEVMDEIGLDFKQDTLLYWLDGGDYIRDNSFTALTAHVIANRIHSPFSEGNLRWLTHPGTHAWFNIQADDTILNCENRNGAILCFYLNDKRVRNFIESWNVCAHTKECIAPEGSSRKNHRQDQSVFTILFWKFMIENPEFNSSNNFFGIDTHRDID